jgi:hypothetical protein
VKAKVMCFIAPPRLLTPDELKATFAQLGKDSPVTLALRQILMERTAELADRIGDVRLTPDQRTHTAGRLEEVMSIHSEIKGMVGAG